MPIKQYAYINSKMLKWAREETPLSIEDVNLRIKDIASIEIEKWENGTELPSITEAKKLANLYDIPFAALYLTKIPVPEKIEYVDRRTLGSSEFEGISYDLWKEIRYFKSCRENLLALMDKDHLGTNIPLFDKNSTIDNISIDIREYLEMTTPLKNKTAFGSNVFSYFRKMFERKGILVFQISGIEVKQIRGISLNYDIYPIIAVNKNDSERAKVFTMFHELAHLIRRTSALCSIDFSIDSDEEEKACDSLAANILVPKYLLEKIKFNNVDNDTISNLADKFGVSSFVILKRLYDENKINYSFYSSKYEELYKNFMENKQIIDKINKNKDSVIPYHIRYLNTNGSLFPSTIINAYYEGRISLGEVCRTLNVKTKQIHKIERAVVF